MSGGDRDEDEDGDADEDEDERGRERRAGGGKWQRKVLDSAIICVDACEYGASGGEFDWPMHRRAL